MKRMLKLALRKSWPYFFISYSVFATLYIFNAWSPFSVISGAFSISVVIFTGNFIRDFLDIKARVKMKRKKSDMEISVP